MASEIDLTRFIKAHSADFDTALQEIRAGRKRTHWMWYIFPQIAGLGTSPNATFFAIKDQAEAAAFLRDDYLGGHLRTITEALLALPTDSAYRVFGTPDDVKLRSSMTLFALVAEQDSVFHKVLGKYFGGVPDKKTLTILRAEW